MVSALDALELGPIGAPEYLAVSAWLLAAGLGRAVLRRDAIAPRLGAVLILQAGVLALVGLVRFAPGWLDAPLAVRVAGSASSVGWGVLLVGVQTRRQESSEPLVPPPVDGSHGARPV